MKNRGNYSKTKPFLSGRIPKELWDAVDANAKATGKTRTEVMIAAVSQYLNLPTAPDPHSKVMELEQDLTALKEQLQASLEELKQQNIQLAERLLAIEAVKSDVSKKSLFPVDEIWDKHYAKNGKR